MVPRLARAEVFSPAATDDLDLADNKYTKKLESQLKGDKRLSGVTMTVNGATIEAEYQAANAPAATKLTLTVITQAKKKAGEPTPAKLAEPSLQLTPPAAGQPWAATLSLDPHTSPNDLGPIVGHQLEQALQHAAGQPPGGGSANMAGQDRPGIFAAGAAPTATPTAHDRATAMQLVNLAVSVVTLKSGKDANINALLAQRTASFTALRAQMALDEPVNMPTKVKLIQDAFDQVGGMQDKKGHGQSAGKQGKTSVQDVLHDAMNVGVDADRTAAIGGAADSALHDDDLAAHMTFAEYKGNFAVNGIGGGHHDDALLAYVRNDKRFILVLSGTHGNYKFYDQYFKDPPNSRTGDGVYASAAAAPADLGTWTKAAFKKSTAIDLKTFMADGDKGWREWVNKNAAIVNDASKVKGKAEFDVNGDPPPASPAATDPITFEAMWGKPGGGAAKPNTIYPKAR